MCLRHDTSVTFSSVHQIQADPAFLSPANCRARLRRPFLYFCPLPFTFLPIPLLQHQSSCLILPVMPHLFLLQHAECFAWEVVAVYVFGIEDVARFMTGEIVEARIVRVQVVSENLPAQTPFAQSVSQSVFLLVQAILLPGSTHPVPCSDSWHTRSC